MTRAVVLSATIAILFVMYLERPQAVESPVVPYCVADWDDPRMFAPCDETYDYRADI